VTVPHLVLGDDVVAPTVTRVAVRAVILDGDRLLMLRSLEGDVKFPGGGVEAGEDAATALAREVDEECGRDLLACEPAPLLVIEERRPDAEDPAQVFCMRSEYYRVQVGEPVRDPSLEAYEADLDLTGEWLTLAEARSANEAALQSGRPAPWVRRELAALVALVALADLVEP
jgi:8-oxo-dGTP pyrophosphatase MutT (NUDIX family)